MDDQDPGGRNLIVGGTIKAATSSLFEYLSAHPQVCGSSVKETFFFTHEYSGDAERDLKRYRRYFPRRPGTRVWVEASPNYLGYKQDVAPRIKALLPGAQLIFVLRNPVDRLYSYFNFARAKLELPADMPFETYVDLCQSHASGNTAALAEKHARALEIGCYSRYLKNFLGVFPPPQVKVMFYEDLHRNPVQFMAEICRFAELDPDFYRHYVFGKVNVTFAGRWRPLHRVALMLNRAVEPVLRQRPALKARIRRAYKRLNQGSEGYAAMSPATRARLAAYYARSNAELAALLAGRPLPAWLGEARAVARQT
jgi:hypothetical protein